MNPSATWRLPLRLARRDALRHRGRSVLVLVMIALPVLAVTAADVLIQTQTSPVPSRLTAGWAPPKRWSCQRGHQQRPAAARTRTTAARSPTATAVCRAPTAEQVSSLLDGARLLELRPGQAEVATDKGRTPAEVTEVDLSDPVADGLFDLTSGGCPRTAGEVVVNQALADKGYRVGDRLDLTADDAPADPTVVGIAESTTARNYPIAAGPLGAFGVDAEASRSWLVDGGPVSWPTVRQLNGIGATVASRAVINDPPPASQVPAGVTLGSTDDATIAVVALIVVMALLEVVLLAGPSFAVSARKLQRSLALMAATGGTPSSRAAS